MTPDNAERLRHRLNVTHAIHDQEQRRTIFILTRQPRHIGEDLNIEEMRGLHATSKKSLHSPSPSLPHFGPLERDHELQGSQERCGKKTCHSSIEFKQTLHGEREAEIGSMGGGRGDTSRQASRPNHHLVGDLPKRAKKLPKTTDQPTTSGCTYPPACYYICR